MPEERRVTHACKLIRNSRKEGEHMQDENQMEEEDLESEGGLKTWLEDNLRIILSILVVFAIAGGIYSYSQRSQTPSITEEISTEKELADSSDQPKEQVDEDANEGKEEVVEEKTQEEESAKTSEDTSINPSENTPEVKIEQPVATSEPESKETGESFIEVAVRGNGATHLARQAVADYLEKNADPTLSKEQKIYIEDYLRKNVSFGHIRVGTSLEFSKTLIQEAIGKSKQLNERQISNLKKYADRVPSIQ